MHPNEIDLVNLAQYSTYEVLSYDLDARWRVENNRASGIPYREAIQAQRQRQLLQVMHLTVA